MSETVDKKEIIADLVIENYSLRNEIGELREKHENECRQISQYDEELKEAKRMATVYDFARMCNNCGGCEECPMQELQNEIYNGVYAYFTTMSEHPKKVSEVVSKWCAEYPETPESVSEQPENPKKSYKDDLFEKFPNVIFRELDCALPCRGVLYGEDIDCESRNCIDCWNEVMENTDE